MNYFEKRKNELNADFSETTNMGLQKIFNVVSDVQREIQKIQRKYQEVDAEEKAEKKATEVQPDEKEPPVK